MTELKITRVVKVNSENPLPLQSRNLAELQGNAKLGDVSKFKIKTLCESSGKIFKETLVQKDLRGEEKAYMMFFKYIC